jgi:hypothetical protein
MCKSKKAHELVTTGSPEHPAFPAQWFYGLLHALPGDRAFCHRHPREALAFQEFDASVEASGPHDFAVRQRHHSSFGAFASTASRPTFVTMANVPLIEAGRAKL